MDILQEMFNSLTEEQKAEIKKNFADAMANSSEFRKQMQMHDEMETLNQQTIAILAGIKSMLANWDAKDPAVYSLSGAVNNAHLLIRVLSFIDLTADNHTKNIMNFKKKYCEEDTNNV